MNDYLLKIDPMTDDIEPVKPELNGFRFNNRAIVNKVK